MSTPAAAHPVLPAGPDDARPAAIAAVRRRRLVLAATAVVAGLSIPITGAGSAIAAPRPPSLTSTVAATRALTAPVAMGKLDV
jgi:hypothetical protein